MLCRRTIICIAVLALFSGELVSCDLDIPSLINVCDSSDPRNCLNTIISILRPHLKNGVPAFGIPPLEPFSISDFEYENTNSPKFDLKCSSLLLDGVTDFQVSEMRFDPQTYDLQVQLLFPQVHLASNYDLTGRYGLIKFEGHDRIEGTFTNIAITVSTRLDTLKNPTTGLVYWKLDDVHVDLNVGKGTLHVYSIKPGIVSGVVNAALKLFWKPLVKKVTPELEQHVAELIDKYGNMVLYKLSEKQLLPV